MGKITFRIIATICFIFYSRVHTEALEHHKTVEEKNDDFALDAGGHISLRGLGSSKSWLVNGINNLVGYYKPHILHVLKNGIPGIIPEGISDTTFEQEGEQRVLSNDYEKESAFNYSKGNSQTDVNKFVNQNKETSGSVEHSGNEVKNVDVQKLVDEKTIEQNENNAENILTSSEEEQKDESIKNNSKDTEDTDDANAVDFDEVSKTIQEQKSQDETKENQNKTESLIQRIDDTQSQNVKEEENSNKLLLKTDPEQKLGTNKFFNSSEQSHKENNITRVDSANIQPEIKQSHAVNKNEKDRIYNNYDKSTQNIFTESKSQKHQFYDNSDNVLSKKYEFMKPKIDNSYHQQATGYEMFGQGPKKVITQKYKYEKPETIKGQQFLEGYQQSSLPGETNIISEKHEYINPGSHIAISQQSHGSGHQGTIIQNEYLKPESTKQKLFSSNQINNIYNTYGSMTSGSKVLNSHQSFHKYGMSEPQKTGSMTQEYWYTQLGNEAGQQEDHLVLPSKKNIISEKHKFTKKPESNILHSEQVISKMSKGQQNYRHFSNGQNHIILNKYEATKPGFVLDQFQNGNTKIKPGINEIASQVHYSKETDHKPYDFALNKYELQGSKPDMHGSQLYDNTPEGYKNNGARIMSSQQINSKYNSLVSGINQDKRVYNYYETLESKEPSRVSHGFKPKLGNIDAQNSNKHEILQSGIKEIYKETPEKYGNKNQHIFESNDVKTNKPHMISEVESFSTSKMPDKYENVGPGVKEPTKPDLETINKETSKLKKKYSGNIYNEIYDPFNVETLNSDVGPFEQFYENSYIPSEFHYSEFREPELESEILHSELPELNDYKLNNEYHPFYEMIEGPEMIKYDTFYPTQNGFDFYSTYLPYPYEAHGFESWDSGLSKLYHDELYDLYDNYFPYHHEMEYGIFDDEIAEPHFNEFDFYDSHFSYYPGFEEMDQFGPDYDEFSYYNEFYPYHEKIEELDGLDYSMINPYFDEFSDYNSYLPYYHDILGPHYGIIDYYNCFPYYHGFESYEMMDGELVRPLLAHDIFEPDYNGFGYFDYYFPLNQEFGGSELLEYEILNPYLGALEYYGSYQPYHDEYDYYSDNFPFYHGMLDYDIMGPHLNEFVHHGKYLSYNNGFGTIGLEYNVFEPHFDELGYYDYLPIYHEIEEFALPDYEIMNPCSGQFRYHVDVNRYYDLFEMPIEYNIFEPFYNELDYNKYFPYLYGIGEYDMLLDEIMGYHSNVLNIFGIHQPYYHQFERMGSLGYDLYGYYGDYFPYLNIFFGSAMPHYALMHPYLDDLSYYDINLPYYHAFSRIGLLKFNLLAPHHDILAFYNDYFPLYYEMTNPYLHQFGYHGSYEPYYYDEFDFIKPLEHNVFGHYYDGIGFYDDYFPYHEIVGYGMMDDIVEPHFSGFAFIGNNLPYYHGFKGIGSLGHNMFDPYYDEFAYYDYFPYYHGYAKPEMFNYVIMNPYLGGFEYYGSHLPFYHNHLPYYHSLNGFGLLEYSLFRPYYGVLGYFGDYFPYYDGFGGFGNVGMLNYRLMSPYLEEFAYYNNYHPYHYGLGEFGSLHYNIFGPHYDRHMFYDDYFPYYDGFGEFAIVNPGFKIYETLNHGFINPTEYFGNVARPFIFNGVHSGRNYKCSCNCKCSYT